MKRALTIKQDVVQIATVERLTNVFEGIASIKISRIRDNVIISKAFFDDLWQTYKGLRINPEEQMKRPHRIKKDHEVVVAITSEGRLSGSLIDEVKDKAKQLLANSDRVVDIMVIGSHGFTVFEQHGIDVTYAYALPGSDEQFDVQEIIGILKEYDDITVLYQTYESLRVQRVVAIELIATIQQLGSEVEEQSENIVSSKTFVFEPGISDIADELESLMMEVALTQMIMESKLAQYASRFNAMNRAKHKASELRLGATRDFYRAKRSESDERLKETMKTLIRRMA